MVLWLVLNNLFLCFVRSLEIMNFLDFKSDLLITIFELLVSTKISHKALDKKESYIKELILFLGQKTLAH